jgi:pimeloyl-ACP methyl ester carboxylesterase
LAALELLAVGAATSAATAAASRRVKAREARAERDYPALGRLIEVEGCRIHAVTEGTGPDLVLLHGASGNLREFTWRLMDRLTPRFRVTTFDRPGLGWSDAIANGADPRAQARVLRRAARRIGIEAPLVLGQSYGGAVALAWALDAPETAGLILVAGAAMPWSGPLGAWYRLTANPLANRALIPLVTAFASRRRVIRTIAEVFAPDPVPAGYAEASGAALALRRATMRENAAQVNGLLPHLRAMAPLYPRLALPIEIVHGSADTIVPLATHSEPLLKAVPSARLSRLDGAGHMPHHSHPEAVLAAIHRAAARADDPAGLPAALR